MSLYTLYSCTTSWGAVVQYIGSNPPMGYSSPEYLYNLMGCSSSIYLYSTMGCCSSVLNPPFHLYSPMACNSFMFDPHSVFICRTPWGAAVQTVSPHGVQWFNVFIQPPMGCRSSMHLFNPPFCIYLFNPRWIKVVQYIICTAPWGVVVNVQTPPPFCIFLYIPMGYTSSTCTTTRGAVVQS